MPVLFLYTQKNLFPPRGAPYSALGPFGGEGRDTGPTAWGAAKGTCAEGGTPPSARPPQVQPRRGPPDGLHPSVWGDSRVSRYTANADPWLEQEEGGDPLQGS